MPKYQLPSTPDTLPLYIAEKLEALRWNPVEDDLDPVRVLFYTPQEERVISDEELQEWKKLEKKILENQNTYKKSTESIEKKAKYDVSFCTIFNHTQQITGRPVLLGIWSFYGPAFCKYVFYDKITASLIYDSHNFHQIWPKNIAIHPWC